MALVEEGPRDARADAKDRWLLAGALGFGVVFGILLFVVVPYFAAQATSGMVTGGGGRLLFNLINGGYKMAVFLLYLWGMSLIPDLRAVFEYHGAEHKSIFAWERDRRISVEHAASHDRRHPRCSTSFLLLVILVAVATFALVLPRHLGLAERLGGELLLLVPIAGVTYELQRLTARYGHWPVLGWLALPGMFLQRLTTREPSSAQLEVAVAALREVLDLERERVGTDLEPGETTCNVG